MTGKKNFANRAKNTGATEFRARASSKFNDSLFVKSEPKNPKVVAIVGPTASGKSALARFLLEHFPLEAISVDSRQVYKDVEIGVGKDYSFPQKMLDILPLNEDVSVIKFRDLALARVRSIQNRGKVPLFVGGTFYYLESIIYRQNFPPKLGIRSELLKLSNQELYNELSREKPSLALAVGRNRRKLLRYLSLIRAGKKIPRLVKRPRFQTLLIAPKISRQQLNEAIERRFKKWLKQGFVREVRALLQGGASEERIKEFGLHYKLAKDFLDGKISQEQLIVSSVSSIKRYARRQVTWLKRFSGVKYTTKEQARRLVKSFLEL